MAHKYSFTRLFRQRQISFEEQIIIWRMSKDKHIKMFSSKIKATVFIIYTRLHMFEWHAAKKVHKEGGWNLSIPSLGRVNWRAYLFFLLERR